MKIPNFVSSDSSPLVSGWFAEVATKTILSLQSYPMETLIGVPLIMLLAYTILGLTGFGSSVVAMPLLVYFMPITLAVAMIAILDLLASLFIGVNNRASVARAEVKLVVPFMLIGIVLGATVLVSVPGKWLMLALGIFVVCNVAYNVLVKVGREPIGRFWAAPLGVLGGVFGALFGTGGPLYAIYLARRLEDKSALRATLVTVIMVSSVARLVAFAIAGLYSQLDVLVAAVCLIPSTIIGLWLGNRMHNTLPAQRVKQGLWILLVVSGLALIVRSLKL